MKLSEFKDEKALDLVADIIEPLSILSVDEDFVNAVKSGNKLKAIKIALKEHQKEIITILALLDGEDPSNYHFNLLQIPKKVMSIINELEKDEDLKSLFLSSDVTETSFTSVSESTEVENE